MPEPAKQPHPLAALGGIAGAAGGFAFSRYCGASAWIPGAALIVLALLFAKSPLGPKHFRGAIATTGAHLTWFILGSVIAGFWSATILDIAALSLGVLWLWWRPGLASALFLGLVQLASLLFNLYTISGVGSLEHRALTAHCTFRIIALVCLVLGYNRLRRERSTPPAISLTLAL